MVERGISDINELLVELGKPELKFTINQTTMLCAVTKLLHPFAIATDKLQGDKVCILFMLSN